MQIKNTNNFEKDINVPSKEQIIIDDVDVSKCTLYGDGRCNNACNPLNCLFCSEKPNCHYKQLARKTQECEKLTNKNNLLTAEINQIKLLLEGKNTQYNVKVEECEELKKENQELRNSLSDSLMFRFTSQDKEVDRYRKALAEIEEYIYNNTDFDINDSIQSKTAGYDILQIIKDV